tara:strand:+ start:355 stop:672 length:318 start_codon:yes stop_codon:yes gene_type:complete
VLLDLLDLFQEPILVVTLQVSFGSLVVAAVVLIMDPMVEVVVELLLVIVLLVVVMGDIIQIGWELQELKTLVEVVVPQTTVTTSPQPSRVMVVLALFLLHIPLDK